ncbi:MAG: VOC family protein [Chthoniobacterales bacterium]|nr:VOC family protein [Chthoniobacterales bacterium]
MLHLDGIDHVALSVGNVEYAANWYVEVLGFERRFQGMWGGVPAFVGKGDTALALFPARTDGREQNEKRAPAIRMLHLAFRATRADFLSAQSELKQRGISFQFQDHEISHSIYFNDPDGHELEITTYDGLGSNS